MSKPFILAIDDDESEVEPLIADEFESRVIDPNDGKLADQLSESIGSASLILLDHKFNNDAQPLSLRAADGASFVSHLRSWSRRESKALPPLILFTSDEEAFANEIPQVGAAVPISGSFVGREHLIAPALDVEWILHKSNDATPEQISRLVRAAVDCQNAIGSNGTSLTELATLLDLSDDHAWSERAKEDLRAARPPVTQADDAESQPCGPSQVIRWLCHRALPFPGMLLSDLYAAWAIGVSLEVFQKMAMAPLDTSDWLSELDQGEYLGTLDGFIGRRWWKAGIDNLVWKLDQESSNLGSRKQAIRSLAPGIEIGKFNSASSYVVTWTPELLENEISPIEDAAQLRPPGWPAEALDPWILKSELHNDAILQSMIDTTDI